MNEIYSDLLQDCKLEYVTSYIYYLIVLFRKIVFGLLLMQVIPKYAQIASVIAVNFVFLVVTGYVIYKGYYNSKLKMITRSINAFCMLAIEVIIFVYNTYDFNLKIRADIGLACLYIALIATIFGII
eukprot:GHVR01167350.1.p1 GENE.GHVR01167350.1~~GHVR01167350.1.p1  ORF type:complete len:127 (-),score=1.31 GHVR01167350.1:965-1345(-)